MEQEKIIDNLVHFARNEEAKLKKVRALKRISKICGWIILLVTFTSAFQDPAPIPAWVLAFASVLVVRLLPWEYGLRILYALGRHSGSLLIWTACEIITKPKKANHKRNFRISRSRKCFNR
ncbi:MAG: hypothetical protein JSW39_20265 [Desulfobacterales bacterium]|nr:MAG: hypothetical protein JSW39_20265 [Desulfobacterales bacterium]